MEISIILESITEIRLFGLPTLINIKEVVHLLCLLDLPKYCKNFFLKNTVKIICL